MTFSISRVAVLCFGALFVASFGDCKQPLIIPGDRASFEALSRRFSFRGGGSSATDDIEDSVGNGNCNSTAVKEEESEASMDNSTSNKVMSLSAPFRMNAVVQEEAATASEEIAPTVGDSDTKQGSHGVLVGGAATVARDKASSKNRLGPLDISRASPLSSRLMEAGPSENIDGRPIEDAATTIPSNITLVTKLWWVNVWTQQLAGLDSQEEPQNDHEAPIDNRAQDKKPKHPDEDTEKLDDMAEISVDKQQRIREKFQEIAQETPTPNVHDKQEGAESTRGHIAESIKIDDSSYISSGLWVPIDNLLTAGLSSQFPSLRASRRLRSVRKYAARLTGLHGYVSGKPLEKSVSFAEKATHLEQEIKPDVIQKPGDDHANQGSDVESRSRTGRRERGLFGVRRERPIHNEKDESSVTGVETRKNQADEHDPRDLAERRKENLEKERREMFENARRMERVKEIDRLISEGQARLQQLVCEKDVLQRRPNPLFNYSTEQITEQDSRDEGHRNESLSIQASRRFKFPPDDLVEEYLDMMFWTRRLSKMNHTDLWKDSDSSEDDDDETLGDDLFTPSADAHILYQETVTRDLNGPEGRASKKGGKRRVKKNGGGGSWLLRQSLGRGPSLGEKIGEAAETAAYKAVCEALMGFLARSLSSLHGINVMEHSDIRLVLEQAPDLPPIGDSVIPASSANYAQETIKSLMKKKARKLKKRSKLRASDDSFVQRDAVTEMLLSHVQISAPLLKLFPLAWQRALLGNIITLSTSMMSDFFDGLQFQILGHRLSFSFQPITEVDMINHLGLAGGGFNHRRAKPEEFEAAVRATADDLGDELKFLDRWHERALGSGVLRSQIANLIARIVLTLTDEVLSGARMDLFCAQAGGPRLVAGLEYRIKTT